MASKEQFGYDYDDSGQRIRLGPGGFGSTYRGWVEIPRDAGESPESAGNVRIAAALKCFNSIVPSDDGQSNSIRREVMLLGRLRHPGIVRFLRFFRDRHVPVIATELIDGRTLHDHAMDIQSAERLGTPEWIDQVLDWGYQLTGVLEYLEQCRVVHRDIKPANIVVDRRSGRPVLIDFGIGRLDGPGMPSGLASTISRGRFVGTYAFASPEQFSELAAGVAGPPGFKSDVYSLGVTLAFALNPDSVDLSSPPADSAEGRRPDINILPAIRGVQSLIADMTAVNPGDRPGAAEAGRRIASIMQGHFDHMPMRDTGELVAVVSRPDQLPRFRSVGRGCEIAEELLNQYAAQFYAEQDSDKIELDASTTHVARRDYRGTQQLIDLINRALADNEWHYRLATRDDWYAAGGAPPAGLLALNASGQCLFADAGPELEWLGDKIHGSFPECRQLAYLGDDETPQSCERHELWPKGAIRLFRQPRMG